MIRQVVPRFFTLDILDILAYYDAKLGFECLGTWQDPPVYAIVARDQQAIHFRCAGPPSSSQSQQIFGRTAGRVHIRRKCGRALR